CRSRSWRRDTPGARTRPVAPGSPRMSLLSPAVLPGDSAVRNRVLQMRLAGASYDAFAKAIDGINDADQAAAEAQLALLQLERLAGWEAGCRSGLEHAKLDLMERNVMAVLQNAAAAGDHPTVLGAVDRLMRLSQQRLMLDTPDGAAPEEVQDPL